MHLNIPNETTQTKHFFQSEILKYYVAVSLRYLKNPFLMSIALGVVALPNAKASKVCM